MTTTFDSAGQLASVRPPSGIAVTYNYDADGNITTTTEASYRYINEYDAAGRNVLLRTEHHIVRDWVQTAQTANAFDADNRIATIVHWNSSSPIHTITQAYDEVSNITRQVYDGAVHTFVYDARNDVLVEHAFGSAPVTYGYDEVSNRAQKEEGGLITSYIYDPANRLLEAIEGAGRTTYLYDANGNRSVRDSSGSHTTYMFDPENRLVELIEPGNIRTTFIYAGDGLRRSYHRPGGLLTTLVYHLNNILEERS